MRIGVIFKRLVSNFERSWKSNQAMEWHANSSKVLRRNNPEVRNGWVLFLIPEGYRQPYSFSRISLIFPDSSFMVKGF